MSEFIAVKDGYNVGENEKYYENNEECSSYLFHFFTKMVEFLIKSIPAQFIDNFERVLIQADY